MRSGVKFLFDNDFSGSASSRPPPVAQAEHEAALAQASERSYREGVAAGKAEAAADSDRRLAAALAKAATGLEGLTRSLEKIEAAMEADTAHLAVAVAGRLAAALIEREPMAEVAALASECFRHVVAAPHVVVRINDALYDEACARLNAIAERCGFAGRLIVLADPEIAVGDCRIEWADGGMTRDRAAVERTIAETVDRYLAARAAAAPKPGSSKP